MADIHDDLHELKALALYCLDNPGPIAAAPNFCFKRFENLGILRNLDWRRTLSSLGDREFHTTVIRAEPEELKQLRLSRGPKPIAGILRSTLFENSITSLREACKSEARPIDTMTDGPVKRLLQFWLNKDRDEKGEFKISSGNCGIPHRWGHDVVFCIVSLQYNATCFGNPQPFVSPNSTATRPIGAVFR